MCSLMNSLIFVTCVTSSMRLDLSSIISRFRDSFSLYKDREWQRANSSFMNAKSVTSRSRRAMKRILFMKSSRVQVTTKCSLLAMTSSSIKKRLKMRNVDKEDETDSTTLLSTHRWTILLTALLKRSSELGQRATRREQRSRKLLKLKWVRRREREI